MDLQLEAKFIIFSLICNSGILIYFLKIVFSPYIM